MRDQDELGSTSHVADANGALLEYYKYDLYGKPLFFDSTSQPLNSSTHGVVDLGNGARWIPQLGLYDDRNRFMSPELGRFLQPDPIGFKGDGSNLYRYVGNDWANRTDPMGTEDVDPHRSSSSLFQNMAKAPFQSERGSLGSQFLNVQRINFRDAVKDMQGFTMGQMTQSANGTSRGEYTYSMKPQYNFGDLAGARGPQYYVATSNSHTSGQCLTGVQHLTGAPNSGAPNGPFNLHRGQPIGPGIPKGTAVARGFELRNGRWVYPSRAAGSYGPKEGPPNHAAIFVAPVDKTHSQVLAQSAGVPLHFETVANSEGWHVITGTIAPSNASTAEVRPWTP